MGPSHRGKKKKCIPTSRAGGLTRSRTVSRCPFTLSAKDSKSHPALAHRSADADILTKTVQPSGSSLSAACWDSAKTLYTVNSHTKMLHNHGLLQQQIILISISQLYMLLLNVSRSLLSCQRQKMSERTSEKKLWSLIRFSLWSVT